MVNSKEIFSIALNLQSPWYVKSVELEEGKEGKKSLHITLDFTKGSRFSIGEETDCKVHDTVKRSWRHLNFFEHECYLHCRVPRVKTTKGVCQVAVPWARSGSGFTLLFEAFAMHLIENEMPVNKVGKTLNEYPNRVWTVFNYWVSISYSEADHSEIEQIGIDEVSSKKGHTYLTHAVDLAERRVVHATVGKDKKTIENIRKYLESKGCPADQIKDVCIDLSPSFISGVTEEFEKAAITFDRFHVKQMLQRAMDEVRKAERKEHHILKGHKYLFLKNNVNLSAKQKQQRDELIELLPNIGKAYQLKVLFDDFWEFETKEEAAAFLTFWCDLVDESKIFPLIKFANSVRSHWSGILKYIDSKISNGILEGINNKIKLAIRRARGYRNSKNLINMIYFIAGKLKFDYPCYST